MADNVTTTTTVSTVPNATILATRSVTYSGDAAAQIAPSGIVVFTGADDAKTATDVGGVSETGTNAVQALAVTGGTPHDSVDSGNPVKIGGKTRATAPTAVAAADRADAWFGLSGEQIGQNVAPQLFATAQTNISNTAATLLAARDSRESAIIVNRQLAAIFVGPATVTTANGFQLDPGASLTLKTRALIQAITSAASGATEYTHTVEVYGS